MYQYEMIATSDENPTERQLAELAVEGVAIRLQTDDAPEVHFIEESPNGYITYPFQIRGYCSCNGRYICLLRGLTPKTLVGTAIHEARHSYQCQNANRHKLSVEMRERDAELFVREFFGTHSNSGDAETLTRMLNEILQEDLDRVWKQAIVSARARLSTKCTSNVRSPARPAEAESSDDLRRRFAPVLQARSLAVQRFIDPNNSRQLFPDNIEFSCPRSTTLTVSYQK